MHVAQGGTRRLVVRAVSIVVLASSVATPTEARADATPTEADVDARYAAIEASLRKGEAAAARWWYGWTVGYGALTVAQGSYAIATSDRGTRVDMIVGGAESLVGVAAILVTSTAPFTATDDLRAMSATTREARLARLRRAESLLEEAADAERFGRSILTHLGGAAVNLAGTFVMWLRYQRHLSGWVNLVGGMAICEAQILLQPTDAIRAWDDYLAGRLSAAARTPPITFGVAPMPGGVVIGGQF